MFQSIPMFRFSTLFCASMVFIVAGMFPAFAKESDIVINELMYHPDSDQAEDEYIELFNRGTDRIDLSGWSFTKGIRYEFETETVL